MDNDPVDSAVRLLRPEPGWAGSAAGRERLQQVLRAEEPTRRQASWTALRRWVPRRPVPVLAGLACLVVIAATLATSVLRSDPTSVSEQRPASGRVETLSAGFAYDVDDLKTVVRQVDEIFVGRVVAVTAIDDETATTTYRVEVEDVVKGTSAGTVAVRQRGYVDTDGTTHVVEGQSLLAAGGRYVLAGNRGDGGLILVGGPHAARALTGDGSTGEVLDTYRAALAAVR